MINEGFFLKRGVVAHVFEGGLYLLLDVVIVCNVVHGALGFICDTKRESSIELVYELATHSGQQGSLDFDRR